MTVVNVSCSFRIFFALTYISVLLEETCIVELYVDFFVVLKKNLEGSKQTWYPTLFLLSSQVFLFFSSIACASSLSSLSALGH